MNNLLDITSIILSITSILTVIYIIGSKFSKLEVKVDTMWEFQMRRALTEVVDRGIGTMKSPLVMDESKLSCLDPIKDSLIEFYDSIKEKVKDYDALLLLEKKFGNDILKTVCIPNSISHGACLFMALSVAKRTTKLDLMV